MARCVLGRERGAASAEVLPPDAQRRVAARRYESAVARVHRKNRAADHRRGKVLVVTLTETGESRINGYLLVLERSLKTWLPADTVLDVVREIDSHVRERVAASDGAPNERAAL